MVKGRRERIARLEVYLNKGTLTPGGTVKITDNTSGSMSITSNVCNFHEFGKKIDLGTKTEESEGNQVPVLAEGASIGMTLQNGTGQFTSNGTQDDVQYFFSDKEKQGVIYVADTESTGHLELTHAHDFEYSADGAALIATCKASTTCALTDNKTTLR